MFPRNKRFLEPYKLVNEIRLLRKIVGSKKWLGNQDIQNEFTKGLEEYNIKESGQQRDIKTGGARTYLAQLEMLGLVFYNKGIPYPTIAGEQLALCENPIDIIQLQLLSLQYPSPYSKNKNVDIDPSVKVRPFMFIVQLLNNSKIKYLTETETIIPIVYGYNHKKINFCIKKILKYRKISGNTKNKKEQIEKLKKVIVSRQDLLTNKTQNRTTDERLKDLNDIANTLINYMNGALLIIKNKSGRSYNYTLNQTNKSKINGNLKSIGKIIPFNSNQKENFQRKFGKFNKHKDTRKISNIKTDLPINGRMDFIRLQYDKFMDLKLHDEIPDKFYEMMKNQYNISKNDVNDSLEDIITNSRNYFENKFISDSLSGQGIEFERSLYTMFRYIFKIKSIHTGQKIDSKGDNFTDVFLLRNTKHECGIIDAKSTNSTYSIHSKDASQMIQIYSRNYTELVGDDYNLNFVGYVCGRMNDNSDYKKHLYRIRNEISRPAFIIDANNILSVSQNYDFNENRLFKFFEQGGVLYSSSY